MENLNQTVTLAGWVQKVRNLGAMTFIDLRDRYGITQLVVEEHSSAELLETASHLGREYVIRATGRVVERASKNAKIPTGEIEVVLESLDVLNASLTPPFTIEDQSRRRRRTADEIPLSGSEAQSAPQRADAASPDGSRDT